MQTQLLQRKMGPKKGRRVRNIEVSTDTPTAFEFEIQWQIYSRGRKRGGKKKRRKRHRNRGRKDHEELFDKTDKHFKDEARKENLWESFANSRKLSVRVCKTWFESQRTVTANSRNPSLVRLQQK